MTTTPHCPACGSKFSHDRTALCCRVCGLPDEVIAQGPKEIARWKRKPWRVMQPEGVGVMQIVPTSLSKSQRKASRLSVHRRQSRMFRPRHGRQYATR